MPAALHRLSRAAAWMEVEVEVEEEEVEEEEEVDDGRLVGCGACEVAF